MRFLKLLGLLAVVSLGLEIIIFLAAALSASSLTPIWGVILAGVLCSWCSAVLLEFQRREFSYMATYWTCGTCCTTSALTIGTVPLSTLGLTPVLILVTINLLSGFLLVNLMDGFDFDFDWEVYFLG